MTYAPKIVLLCPIQDETALEPFVEACLRDKVELIAVVGKGCARIEDLIDEIIVGDGSDDSRFILTTSHADERVEDALEFAEEWVCEDGRKGVQKVVL